MKSIWKISFPTFGGCFPYKQWNSTSHTHLANIPNARKLSWALFQTKISPSDVKARLGLLTMTSNWGPKRPCRGNAVSIATLLEMLCRQLLIFPVSLFYIRSWRIAKRETVTISQIFASWYRIVSVNIRCSKLVVGLLILRHYIKYMPVMEVKVGYLSTFHCCII